MDPTLFDQKKYIRGKVLVILRSLLRGVIGFCVFLFGLFSVAELGLSSEIGGKIGGRFLLVGGTIALVCSIFLPYKKQRAKWIVILLSLGSACFFFYLLCIDIRDHGTEAAIVLFVTPLVVFILCGLSLFFMSMTQYFLSTQKPGKQTIEKPIDQNSFEQIANITLQPPVSKTFARILFGISLCGLFLLSAHKTFPFLPSAPFFLWFSFWWLLLSMIMLCSARINTNIVSLFSQVFQLCKQKPHVILATILGMFLMGGLFLFVSMSQPWFLWIKLTVLLVRNTAMIYMFSSLIAEPGGRSFFTGLRSLDRSSLPSLLAFHALCMLPMVLSLLVNFIRPAAPAWVGIGMAVFQLAFSLFLISYLFTGLLLCSKKNLFLTLSKQVAQGL